MDNKKASALLSMIEFEHAECCLNTWYKGIDDDMKEALEMAIEALEQTSWIPVSERLPEDFQRVLVTVVNYKGDKVVRVAEYNNWKGVFKIKENNEQLEVGEKGLLAWMPLPQPYTGESEG